MSFYVSLIFGRLSSRWSSDWICKACWLERTIAYLFFYLCFKVKTQGDEAPSQKSAECRTTGRNCAGPRGLPTQRWNNNGRCSIQSRPRKHRLSFNSFHRHLWKPSLFLVLWILKYDLNIRNVCQIFWSTRYNNCFIEDWYTFEVLVW